MASKRAKFSVGLFVAFGITIALTSFIWLGMSRFLQKGKFYATYFNESVQGLDKDSPVKYRGVPIGRVDRIGVAPDEKLIEVILKLETDQSLDSSMVAQLKTVGITGSMFVEIDRKKPGQPDLSPRIDFPSNNPIVSSKPSDISKLIHGLDDIINQVRLVDLAGISQKIKTTLDNVSAFLSDADAQGVSGQLKVTLKNVDRIIDSDRWEQILASTEKTLGSARALLGRVGGSLGRIDSTLEQAGGLIRENRENIAKAIEDLRVAVGKADMFLEKGSDLAKGSDDALANLTRQLLVVGQNMERASENLNRVFELLADQPSQLIFGEPPLPRKVESNEGN